MAGHRMRRAVVVIGALLATGALAAGAAGEHSVLELVSTGPAGGNGAPDSEFGGASSDGARVFFGTDESLVSTDTDTQLDVYERSGGQTTLISTGPIGGNGDLPAGFWDVSADGAHVFFSTREALVSADGDTAQDIYERSAGQTTLISTGSAGGNDDLSAQLEGLSSDGAHAFFLTEERLESGDTDTQWDVYERSGGQTTLVSTGPSGGNGAFNAIFGGASAGGGRAFFVTQEPLVSADIDMRVDVYERSGGQTTLISTGPDGGNGEFDAGFPRMSADGARVVFSTDESLVGADTDAQIDLYERSGGQTTLISTGPDGGNGEFDASPNGVSADGARVLFSTPESLVSADTDTENDVYERSGGQTTLISIGPDGGNGPFGANFEGVSADGTGVLFNTDESLVSADTDTENDVYERSGGQTTLISTGPSGGNGAFDPSFEDVSADGAVVLFSTDESLVSADTDAQIDVYERSGGQTTLISTGPSGGNGAFGSSFEGVSADGARVLFSTDEALIGADSDTAQDVYVKRILPAPGNTARPAISGVAEVGRTLACSRGSWTNDPTSFAYAWKRDGAAIAGATSSQHRVTGVDVGRPITCTVTASNGGGTGTATSAPVTPTGAPGPGLLPGRCANVQTGAAAADRLTGSAFGDRLRGLAGNDVLIGLAGDDCLSGGAGNDRLTAGAGKDKLKGGAGKDKLKGGSGKDKLTGGKGKDKLNGGPGDDTINARDDRRETVRCGSGKKDRATVDRIDRVVRCEKVKRG